MKWLVIAALVLVGCKKKTEEAPPPPATTGSAVATGSGSAMVPDTTPPATAAAGSAVDVPTEQDFEDKAASDITDKNVGDKLKTLEADLAPQ